MLGNMKHSQVFHLVILPFYKEKNGEIVDSCMESLLRANYDKKKMAVVLACEERAGEGALRIAGEAEKKFGGKFGNFLVTVHPEAVPGEMAGKGSNISYAAEEARKKILDAGEIPYENVLVSAFDIDTVVYPDYFSCLTWNFLASPNPYRFSYQPVPLYNNNMWQSPALSRVVANSGTFWQMIQQERPERLTTFSSHSMTFKALYEVGYWQKNIVSEDSRIFWNEFLANDGNYVVVPLSYPVSMDANLAAGFWQTMKNVYKQQRRWSWGAENIPYLLMGFIKNKSIPRWKKIKISVLELERAWSLSTDPIILFFFTWVPVIVGGRHFDSSLLSYNMITFSRYVSLLGALGIVLSAILSMTLIPPPPGGKEKSEKAPDVFAVDFHSGNSRYLRLHSGHRRADQASFGQIYGILGHPEAQRREYAGSRTKGRLTS